MRLVGDLLLVLAPVALTTQEGAHHSFLSFGNELVECGDNDGRKGIEPKGDTHGSIDQHPPFPAELLGDRIGLQRQMRSRDVGAEKIQPPSHQQQRQEESVLL